MIAIKVLKPIKVVLKDFSYPFGIIFHKFKVFFLRDNIDVIYACEALAKNLSGSLQIFLN